MSNMKFDNGLYIVDDEYRILYANENLINHFPKTTVGDFCYKSIANRNAPCTFCPIKSNHKQGTVVFNTDSEHQYSSIFTNIQLPDGTHCYSVTLQEQQQELINSSNFDLSSDERKKIFNQQKEIEQRNEIIQILAEEYLIIYYVYNENGVFKCIKAFDNSSDYSYSMSEIAISDYSSIFKNYAVASVHPEDRQKFIEKLSPDFILKLIDNGEVYNLNFRRVTDDKTNYMQLRFIPVIKDNSTHLIVAFRSIDNIIKKELKQKQAITENLSNAQQRLKIIEALCTEYEALYFVDTKRDLGVPYVLTHKFPDHFKEMILQEFPFKQFYYQYIETSLPPEKQNELKLATDLDKITKILETEKTYSVNFEINYNDKVLNYQIFIAKFDEPHEQVWAFRNIDHIVKEQTHQRELLVEALDKAKKAEHAKSNFLFNMSHDIRTPMNAILGFNSIAEKNIDNKEVVLDALKKAKNSGEHMLSIINDILDMARIESGKFQLNNAVVDVKDLINKMEEMFAFEMKEKNINFTVIADITTPFIYTDSLRLSQIMINLLSNALKFTNPGGTVVFQITETGSADDELAHYQIRVEDTGIGMSEEFQKHLFNVFEREYNTTQSGIQGTGLGLAITKNLVSLLGGTLSYNSMLGFGTEFVVTINMKKAEQHENTYNSASNLLPELKGSRILVVEDNVINREITRELLEDEGFLIEDAEDGAIAVKKLEASSKGYYDFVLMDIQMPIMNGYTATRKIRFSENSDICNIPIIALTANAFNEDKLNAIDSGMDAHVAKPLNVDELIETINNVYLKRKNKQ